MTEAKTPDGAAAGERAPAVPSPVPPDSGDAWYAPDVRAQYELCDGVVATIRETENGFAYETREPTLGAEDEAALARIRIRPDLFSGRSSSRGR